MSRPLYNVTNNGPIIDTIVPINLARLLWALKSRLIPPRAQFDCDGKNLYKVTANNAPIIDTTTIVPMHFARGCCDLSSPALIQAFNILIFWNNGELCPQRI